MELQYELADGSMMLKGMVPEEFGSYKVQDVSSHLEAWARGERLFSRLSWADTLRNIRIAHWLAEREPVVVVEVGCGYDHPIGRMIAGQGMDTHYVGIDVVGEHAQRVTGDEGKRPFVGVWHDVTEGIPLREGKADVVMSMEMAAQAFPDEEELSKFFGEVYRVLQPWGTFFLATPCPGEGDVLQHAHCHTNEFTPQQVESIARSEGLEITSAWNYRAKPEIVEKLRKKAARDRVDMDIPPYPPLPRAAMDAFALPYLTGGPFAGRLVPGNAVYVMELAER